MHHARRLPTSARTLVVAASHLVHLDERDRHVSFTCYSLLTLSANNLDGNICSSQWSGLRSFTDRERNP